MKQFTLVINSLALFACFAAHPVVAGICSRLIEFDSFELAARAEADLTSSIWTMHECNSSSTASFMPDGTLEKVRSTADNNSIVNVSWKISTCEGRVLLTIAGANGQVELFDVRPTCSGFDLIAMNGRMVNLEKIGVRREAQVLMVEKQITGSWLTASETGTEIEWDFKEDGTFWVSIGPDKFHSRLEGNWDVTDDGMHLELEFAHEISPGEAYAHEVVKMHHVDFEDAIFSGTLLKRLCALESNESQVHFAKKYQF